MNNQVEETKYYVIWDIYEVYTFIEVFDDYLSLESFIENILEPDTKYITIKGLKLKEYSNCEEGDLNE